MVALCISLAIIGSILTAILTFWHRRLMVCLREESPETWQRLGREDVFGHLWPLSVRYPLWSWSSIFFLLTAQFKKLGDPTFNKKAQRFRIALFALLAYDAVLAAIVITALISGRA